MSVTVTAELIRESCQVLGIIPSHRIDFREIRRIFEYMKVPISIRKIQEVTWEISQHPAISRKFAEILEKWYTSKSRAVVSDGFTAKKLPVRSPPKISTSKIEPFSQLDEFLNSPSRMRINKSKKLRWMIRSWLSDITERQRDRDEFEKAFVMETDQRFRLSDQRGRQESAQARERIGRYRQKRSLSMQDEPNSAEEITYFHNMETLMKQIDHSKKKRRNFKGKLNPLHHTRVIELMESTIT